MADNDPYQAAGGSLKLKGFALSNKKKKKKKNAAKKVLEQISSNMESEETGPKMIDNRTKAQKAFDKVREKRQEEKILEKARKKHKDHVEEFNSRLDQLTEHFDIPKVSWTK